MMKTVTLTLTGMGNGGVALGRDAQDRVVFVPYTIPGERVQVELLENRGKHFHRGRVHTILEASPYRTEPRCPHFGSCGGCHFQHIQYGQQLVYKQAVVAEQLQRLGGFPHPPVRPTLANPEPYGYSYEMMLTPLPDGQSGLWSPGLQQVIPITDCPITQPALLDLRHDLVLDFPGLRRIILRQGDDASLLALLDLGDNEAPELEVDFPISVAVLLPDGAAATLIGDPYLVQVVKGREFRLSPSCYFPPSPAAAALLVDTLLHYAKLQGTEQVLELYSGIGLFSRWLAERCAALVGVEQNPDAVHDAAVNLDETDNVSLYQGAVEDVLLTVDFQPDLLVVNPPAQGVSKEVLDWVRGRLPARILYVSADVATLARDGKGLAQAGYRLVEVQPVDTRPQTYHIETISYWQLT
ncbi:MAG: methyltransferase [Anaerolineae bacterium]|nr:methyltransferase [Anaerolineae bacterium]